MSSRDVVRRRDYVAGITLQGTLRSRENGRARSLRQLVQD